jgi:predicted nucleotidyltransferase component of viral defense system
MNVLTPLQRDFLYNFFAQPAAAPFALTGGTALAAYYLHHRTSEDVDLFAVAPITDLKDTSLLDAGRLAAIAAAEIIGASHETRPLSTTLQQVFLTRADEPRLKIDIVRDPGPLFGEISEFDGIRVDSQLNIAANKVNAIFGRTAARDFIDLYALLHAGFDFDELFALARQKDPGLEEFYFSRMVRLVSRLTKDDMPKMLKPIDLEAMKQFFLDLADELADRANPTQWERI